MQVGIIKTNGGKHSDAKLAYAAADDIVNISADSVGEDVADLRELSNQIGGVLKGYFEKISEHEHAQINEKGTAHLNASLDANPELHELAIKDIETIIAKSPFQMPDGVIRKSLDSYFKVAQHMHRDWFAAHGKVGDGTDLVDASNHDPKCQNVVRWNDMQHGDPDTARAALASHNAARDPAPTPAA